MLLDLSAVYNTVDYDILIGRLTSRLGFKGVILQWLNSYLRSRTQAVTVMDAMSVLAELLFGIPQGSVLGPLLFVLYVLPLSDIARQHGVSMHSYADDIQLYISFDHKDSTSVSEAVKSLECCIDDIRIWMLRNRLKMNDSKTEMIIFASPVKLSDFKPLRDWYMAWSLPALTNVFMLSENFSSYKIQEHALYQVTSLAYQVL